MKIDICSKCSSNNLEYTAGNPYCHDCGCDSDIEITVYTQTELDEARKEERERIIEEFGTAEHISGSYLTAAIRKMEDI
jgi:hypothetical protein